MKFMQLLPAGPMKNTIELAGERVPYASAAPDALHLLYEGILKDGFDLTLQIIHKLAANKNQGFAKFVEKLNRRLNRGVFGRSDTDTYRYVRNHGALRIKEDRMQFPTLKGYENRDVAVLLPMAVGSAGEVVRGSPFWNEAIQIYLACLYTACQLALPAANKQSPRQYQQLRLATAALSVVSKRIQDALKASTTKVVGVKHNGFTPKFHYFVHAPMLWQQLGLPAVVSMSLPERSHQFYVRAPFRRMQPAEARLEQPSKLCWCDCKPHSLPITC